VRIRTAMLRELHLPASVLTGLALSQPEHFPALFDSAAAGILGRYSILAAYPEAVLALRADGSLHAEGVEVIDPRAEVIDPRAEVVGAPDAGFLSTLERWWRALRTSRDAEEGEEGFAEHGEAALPFRGGWALFLAYELAGEIEPSLALPAAPLGWNAIALRVRCGLALEHASGRMFAFAESGAELQLERLCAAAAAQAAQAALEGRHETGGGFSAGGAEPRVSDARGTDARGADSTRSQRPSIGALREEDPALYLARVGAAQAHIAAGDIYQANLSRWWRAPLAGRIPSRAIYDALRRANPAPFAGLFQWQECRVLSSSPERLVRSEGGIAHTRPIAGTRPRSGAAQDAASEIDAMVASAKECAEHVMLVDLERNDLGRVCERGSVRVEELMTVESYPHVHHIVSKVTGRLRAETSPIDLIRAVLPGGTITGCPKHRCMQIIAALEGEGRGAYTGSMGWLDRSGDLDLNILIRTLTLTDRMLEIRTGAGIVADSAPLAELAETRAKARAMLAAIESLSDAKSAEAMPV